MGVSGCGKSTLGRAIALQTGYTFVEGDELHSKSNIEKMMNGKALSDEDRHAWLKDICLTLQDATKKHEKIIVSCSALKQSYRDVLIAMHPQLCFLWCHASYEVIYQRLRNRQTHFMPLSLLKSQYEILEPPPTDALQRNMLTRYYKIDVTQRIEHALTECMKYIEP